MTANEWQLKTPGEKKAVKDKFRKLIVDQKLKQKQAAATCNITTKTASTWVKEMGITYERERGGNKHYSLMEIRNLRSQAIVCLAGYELSNKITAEILGLCPQTICDWLKKWGGREAVTKLYNSDRHQYLDSAETLYMFIKKNKDYKRFHDTADKVMETF